MVKFNSTIRFCFTILRGKRNRFFFYLGKCIKTNCCVNLHIYFLCYQNMQEILFNIYAECFMCVFLDAKFACSLAHSVILAAFVYAIRRAHTFTQIQIITDAHRHRQCKRTNEWVSERTSERKNEQNSHLYTHRTFSAVHNTLMESTMKNERKK